MLHFSGKLVFVLAPCCSTATAQLVKIRSNGRGEGSFLGHGSIFRRCRVKDTRGISFYLELWNIFIKIFSQFRGEMRERRGAVRCGVCAGLSGRGSRTWKISLFYLNRILNFNSESITRIIVCCMKFRKIEKSPNLWCSRQSSDHRLGWGWKPGIICLLGRDVLLVSVARAAGCSTGDPLHSPYTISATEKF